MQHEFRGKTLQEAVQKAVVRAPSTKQTPEVWAPPLVWGPWYHLMDVWASRGGDVHISVSFDTISDAPSAFGIEIAEGKGARNVLSTSGPGSETYTIPHLPDYGAFVTALYIRAKSFSLGQLIDVQASYDTARNRAENEKLYVWVTRGDDRVRPSHAENNGKIFSWDDPPTTGHPGEDFGCRCVARPLLD